jgi:long-chain acyl-CoA synthetase
LEKTWFELYDKGVPYSILYPPLALKDLFSHHVKTNPERKYLILNDITITYRECNEKSCRLANWLLKMGVKKGDRVAFMIPNVPQYVIALQACFKIGAIVVPVNPLAPAPEVAHYLEDSGAGIMIVMALLANTAIAVLKEGKTPMKQLITFQVKAMAAEIEKHKDIYDFDEIIATSNDAEPDIKVYTDDIAMLQYTGGTTGVSKACVLHNRNILALAYQENYWLATVMDKNEEFRSLAAIPLYHIYGFNTNVNINLVAGGSIVLVPQPTTDNILAAVNMHEPNFFAAVPTMIIGLNQHPDISKSKIRSIKGMISGSAPLALEALKTFEELSGAIITEGYGMSESSNVLTVNPLKTVRKPGGVGLPMPDNDLKIVDIDTGTQEMPTGEPGEIIARGPSIMSEYWNKPEETAQAIRDGWFYTGDIGYIDQDGHVFIVDRKKDMIISSGFNVYPRDIDELMYTHPKVLRACAFGVPDEKRGEAVKLTLVLKPGETMTVEEVLTFCKENLTAYKVPREVEFLEDLPLTPVGKADRKELRRRELEKRA